MRRRGEEKANFGNVAVVMLVTGQAERSVGEPVAHHQAQPVFISRRPWRQSRIERFANGRLWPEVGDVEHDLRILLQGEKKRPVVQLQR